MRALTRALLAPLLLAVGLGVRAECPKDLRIGFNDADFPPMLYGAGESFAQPDPGWLVRLAQRALASTGCNASWVRRPVRRLEAELEAGSIGVALLFGATEERQQRLAFPLDARGRLNEQLALVVSELSLYTLPERRAALGWDGRRVAAGKRIGVVRGTAQDQIAQELGLPLEPISSFAASVVMLQAGRFDALLMNPEAVPQHPDAAALVIVQPPVRRIAYFAAASLGLRRQSPEFLNRYWLALCRALRDEPLAPRSGCALAP
jgi:ABC-type amino acid transport substrate-binding protein